MYPLPTEGNTLRSMSCVFSVVKYMLNYNKIIQNKHLIKIELMPYVSFHFFFQMPTPPSPLFLILPVTPIHKNLQLWLLEILELQMPRE